MENPPSSKNSRFPTFGRLRRYIFSWRTWRHSIMGAAILVTLIALFYAEEDFRGKRAWNRYKHQLEAKGVELNWHAMAPPPVPDEQNFAMTPFLKPMLEFNPEPLKPNQSRWRDTNGYERAVGFSELAFDRAKMNKIKPSNWLRGQLLDLQALTSTLRDATNATAQGKVYATRAEAGEALLRGLQPCEPVLDELREASRRPHSRFNISYGDEDIWAILLAHLAPVNGASKILSYRASAELAVGKSDAAFEDVKLTFYLADSIRDEPFLISQLVRNAILGSAQRMIWEGLAQRSWTDGQLQDFQARLQSIALIQELGKGMAAERAAGNTTFDMLRKNPGYLDSLFDKSYASVLFRIFPVGWLYREQLSYNRLFDERILAGIDWEAGKIEPKTIESNADILNNLGTNEMTLIRQHVLFSRLLLPAIGRISAKFAFGQTLLDEADVACALERYRLAKGQFPETLDALTPQFIPKIPHGVIDGEPLKYRRTDEGQFILYTAGWNEGDNWQNNDEGLNGRFMGATISPHGNWTWPPYPSSK